MPWHLPRAAFGPSESDNRFSTRSTFAFFTHVATARVRANDKPAVLRAAWPMSMFRVGLLGDGRFTPRQHATSCRGLPDRRTRFTAKPGHSATPTPTLCGLHSINRHDNTDIQNPRCAIGKVTTVLSPLALPPLASEGRLYTSCIYIFH